MRTVRVALCAFALLGASWLHASAENWAKRYLKHNGQPAASVTDLEPVASRLEVVAAYCGATHMEVALTWTVVYRAAHQRWLAIGGAEPSPRNTAFLFYGVIVDEWNRTGGELSKEKCVAAVEEAIESDKFPSLMAQAILDDQYGTPVTVPVD